MKSEKARALTFFYSVFDAKLFVIHTKKSREGRERCKKKKEQRKKRTQKRRDTNHMREKKSRPFFFTLRDAHDRKSEEREREREKGERCLLE
jgi:hypothetical protein